MPKSKTPERKLLSQKECVMKVSIYEATLILELRKLSFGNVTIYKNMGEPFRINLNQSKNLNIDEAVKSEDVQIL
jgi:hypothetical protein